MEMEMEMDRERMELLRPGIRGYAISLGDFRMETGARAAASVA